MTKQKLYLILQKESIYMQIPRTHKPDLATLPLFRFLTKDDISIKNERNMNILMSNSVSSGLLI
jgi:hypothetical protein